jgi:hypothetical protein
LCDNPDSFYSSALLDHPALPRLALRIAPESFLIAGWRMIRPQSTRKAQMKTILTLIVGLMLAGCGSMENHVRNRNAVDTICACP